MQLAVKYSDMKLTSMIGDGIARDMLTAMKAVTNNTSSKKFRLYSGHDSTIWMHLVLLNVTDFDCVQDWALDKPLKRTCIVPSDFASSLLYELNKRGSDYYVRTIFNGDPIKICDQNEDEFYCKFEDFKKVVSTKMFYLDKDFDEYCGSPYKYKGKTMPKQSYASLTYLGIFFGLIFLILLALYSWLVCNQHTLRLKYHRTDKNRKIVAPLVSNQL